MCSSDLSLQSIPHWSPDKLAADMKADWGIDCNEEEDEEASEERVSAGDKGEMTHDDEESPHIYSVKGLRLVVAMMDAPVPDGEAEANAANNYMWPEAVETVKTHKAHLMVAVMGTDAPVKERGLLFAKLMAACCRQETVLGIYTSGTVFQHFSFKITQAAQRIGMYLCFGILSHDQSVFVIQIG